MNDLKLSHFTGIEEGRVADVQGKPFTQVPNYITMDERLSGTAKYVMNYALLRSGLERWEIRKKDVIKHTKEQRNAIDNAFELLIKTGYLVQSEIYRDEKTGHSKRKYMFYKDPANNPYYDGELPTNEFYDIRNRLYKKNPSAGEPTGNLNKQETTSIHSIPEEPKKATKNFKNFKDTVDDFDYVE